MSDKFTVEIISPDKSILKTEASEVTIPSYEGEIGILKNHISLITFLKPGILTIHAKSGEHKFYVEDGIFEFKNNTLSVLSSSIFDLKKIVISRLMNLFTVAEEEASKQEIDDQSRFLIDQKIEVLKSLN